MNSVALPFVSVFDFWTCPPHWSFQAPPIRAQEPQRWLLWTDADLLDKLPAASDRKSTHWKIPAFVLGKYHTWLDISFRDKRRKVVQKAWHQRNIGIHNAYYPTRYYLLGKVAFFDACLLLSYFTRYLTNTYLLLHQNWAINFDSLNIFFFYYVPEIRQNMHYFPPMAITSINSKEQSAILMTTETSPAQTSDMELWTPNRKPKMWITEMSVTE